MSSSRFGNTIPILMCVALRKPSLVFRDVSLFIIDLIALAASAIRFSRSLSPEVSVSVADSDSVSFSLLDDFDLI
ncbi:hypothetical protein SDJN03_12121, partial [Cucurbita argyrosperma subsp. sororia]